MKQKEIRTKVFGGYFRDWTPCEVNLSWVIDNKGKQLLKRCSQDRVNRMLKKHYGDVRFGGKDYGFDW